MPLSSERGTVHSTRTITDGSTHLGFSVFYPLLSGWYVNRLDRFSTFPRPRLGIGIGGDADKDRSIDYGQECVIHGAVHAKRITRNMSAGMAGRSRHLICRVFHFRFLPGPHCCPIKTRCWSRRWYRSWHKVEQTWSWGTLEICST